MDPNWEGLSDRGREILRRVALPISLGLSHREVADQLNRDRPETGAHLALPDRVTEEWIGARMRELRAELKDVSG